MTDAPQTYNPRRVLVVMAHPDDAEFFCGGTLARWAAEGAQITLVVATSGDKGSGDPDMTRDALATLREEEQRRAAAVWGAQDVVYLRYADGELTPSLDLRRDIARMIRLRQPDTVVTLDPTVFWWGTRSLNHPDHRAIGEATLDAIYPTARDRLNFIELERDEGLSPHKVRYVYIAGAKEPTQRVDVTDYIEIKLAALREHASQIADFAAVEARVRGGVDAEQPPEYQRYTDAFRVITFER